MIKPHIVVSWRKDGKDFVDGYAVVDTPQRRQCMKDWCAEMNAKYGENSHWVHEFLADDTDDFDTMSVPGTKGE